MYQGIKIGKPEIKKSNYFELSVFFNNDSNKNINAKLELKSEKDLLNVVNELKKINKWTSKSDLEDKINNKELVEAINEDIFLFVEEDYEIRFEKSSYLIIYFYDENGNKCNVELIISILSKLK